MGFDFKKTALFDKGAYYTAPAELPQKPGFNIHQDTSKGYIQDGINVSKAIMLKHHSTNDPSLVPKKNLRLYPERWQFVKEDLNNKPDPSFGFNTQTEKYMKNQVYTDGVPRSGLLRDLNVEKAANADFKNQVEELIGAVLNQAAALQALAAAPAAVPAAAAALPVVGVRSSIPGPPRRPPVPGTPVTPPAPPVGPIGASLGLGSGAPAPGFPVTPSILSAGRAGLRTTPTKSKPASSTTPAPPTAPAPGTPAPIGPRTPTMPPPTGTIPVPTGSARTSPRTAAPPTAPAPGASSPASSSGPSSPVSSATTTSSLKALMDIYDQFKDPLDYNNSAQKTQSTEVIGKLYSTYTDPDNYKGLSMDDMKNLEDRFRTNFIEPKAFNSIAAKEWAKVNALFEYSQLTNKIPNKKTIERIGGFNRIEDIRNANAKYKNTTPTQQQLDAAIGSAMQGL